MLEENIYNEIETEDLFLYNVTIKVAETIAADWLPWMQEVHIPAIMATDCFTHARIFRLLEIDDSEGPTYAVQYFANSKSNYNRYISLHADEMRQESYDKWGDQFIAFRSLMQGVQ